MKNHNPHYKRNELIKDLIAYALITSAILLLLIYL